ncbi:MAG: hypothetical protein RLP09_09680 [Sandaracinaceae bacterium]
MKLLALDPSLACTGWVVVALDGSRDLLAAGAIPTVGRVPRTADAILVQADAARRGKELARGVTAVLREHVEVEAVAVEFPLGAQDAAAAWSLARANQAAVCAVDLLRPRLLDNGRLIAVSPFEAKRAATGRAQPGKKGPDGKVRPGSAKAAVRRGVRRIWGPGAWDRALVHVRADAEREAAYDAGANALVALEHPLVRSMTAPARPAEEATCPR